MSYRSRLSFLAFAFLAATTLLCPIGAAAQCVSLTTLGSASTQNFDTLSNTAGSTTNNLTIPGWFLTESGGGARDNEQYAVDTGGSTSGDMYSYGAAGSTERALGQLRSGTLIPLFGACFTNNTGSTVTSLAVAYNGEEWRLGTAGRTDQMNFEYSLNATDLVTGTWTGVAALNFVTPDTATTGAKNGNAAADRTALSSTISSLSIPNGATFWIRWNDTDATGADDGLAVDDFSLTPNAVPPVNLTINDVSLNEGNAGTTSFTFTVSLSSPAGPGGVTFDIATADGTATQPSDYTQKSLTAQTIPAGSSTYSFTVLVNGDTSPETNETFLVNVTNVTGATVMDGQGQGTIVNDDAAPNLSINDVSLSEGNAGTTTYTFTVSLSAPAPAGGVTFDIATADGTATSGSDYTAKSLTGQTIPAGSSTYTFDVLVNGDTTPEPDETFFVNVSNVGNAITVDGQGLGTIVNDDITKIHDVQGNGASTPIPGATVTVEGVVTANFQGANKLQGFFLQEEDADADADPMTSEGIFIFCGSCSTPVAEGQRVKATGTVSEFNGMTQVTASAAGSVVVTDAANHLAEVTPAPIALPIAGDVDAFYEAREGMLVTFADTLSVAEYFELSRFGHITLYQGGRPFQFTEGAPPNAAGLIAHEDGLARRRVILDDDNNAQEAYLNQPDGSQFIFYPQANGGFSVGTQGVDFFRGGDLVNGLTGVLHWSFPGFGANTWRIRPTAAHPVTFTVANPRPVTPPAVGGAIKAVGMNLLNYFTTIDTTSSNNTGPCGPAFDQDCRGADSVAELNRQRERASIVVCTLNADIYAFMELENTTPSDTINDLLGAINARCGGAHPFAFVNTGGTLGTDAIRVQEIYRTGIVSPVGSPLVDLDPIHNRPPTAQTFDVVDAANPAFGKRFTVIANHFKSKGCPGTGADADQGDGQSCFADRRTQQAARLLTWINGTVLPAAGNPDILLLGDFNSYAQEPPVTTLESGGFTDLETAFGGASTYSYLFSGELGHLDYAFSSSSLTSKITGAAPWHINADEVDLFDYNDEIKDAGEATFEEKPDGSALVPPRVVFQPGTPYRASDHDPVLVGLFQVADLAITKVDTPDPVIAGTNLTYTITVTNNGPDAAASRLLERHPAGRDELRLPPRGRRLVVHYPGGGGGRHDLLLQPVVRGGERGLHAHRGGRPVGGRRHRPLEHRGRHLDDRRRQPGQRERHGDDDGGGIGRPVGDQGGHARPGEGRYQPDLHDHVDQRRSQRDVIGLAVGRPAGRDDLRFARDAGRLALHHSRGRGRRHGLVLGGIARGDQCGLHPGGEGRSLGPRGDGALEHGHGLLGHRRSEPGQRERHGDDDGHGARVLHRRVLPRRRYAGSRRATSRRERHPGFPARRPLRHPVGRQAGGRQSHRGRSAGDGAPGSLPRRSEHPIGPRRPELRSRTDPVEQCPPPARDGRQRNGQGSLGNERVGEPGGRCRRVLRVTAGCYLWVFQEVAACLTLDSISL